MSVSVCMHIGGLYKSHKQANKVQLYIFKSIIFKTTYHRSTKELHILIYTQLTYGPQVAATRRGGVHMCTANTERLLLTPNATHSDNLLA